MRKIINPVIADYMVKSSKNLFNAATSGDTELAQAVLKKLRNELDSYIQLLDEG